MPMNRGDKIAIGVALVSATYFGLDILFSPQVRRPKETKYFVDVSALKDLPRECDTVSVPMTPCAPNFPGWPCCLKWSTRPCDTIPNPSGPCRAGSRSFPCCADER